MQQEASAFILTENSREPLLVSRAAIDKILNGEDVDLSDAVFVYELEPGEGAENGIAASKEGAVILTNLKCYLLQADNGVKKSLGNFL